MMKWKEERGQTDFTEDWKRVDRHQRRKGDSTHFNITTAGVESRNPVGGTADSLCRPLTKKTIKVRWSTSLQLNEARCFPGVALSLSSSHLLRRLPTIQHACLFLHAAKQDTFYPTELNVVPKLFQAAAIHSCTASKPISIGWDNPWQQTWFHNLIWSNSIYPPLSCVLRLVSLCFFQTLRNWRLWPGNNPSKTRHFVNFLTSVSSRSECASPETAAFTAVARNKAIKGEATGWKVPGFKHLQAWITIKLSSTNFSAVSVCFEISCWQADRLRLEAEPPSYFTGRGEDLRCSRRFPECWNGKISSSQLKLWHEQSPLTSRLNVGHFFFLNDVLKGFLEQHSSSRY